MLGSTSVSSPLRQLSSPDSERNRWSAVALPIPPSPAPHANLPSETRSAQSSGISQYSPGGLSNIGRQEPLQLFEVTDLTDVDNYKVIDCFRL